MTAPQDQGRGRPLLQLGRLRGVPVVVSPSWVLVAVLLTAVYGPLVRDSVEHIGSRAAYLASFGFALLFGLCILAHELGHTLVSTYLGYPVKRVVLFALGGLSEIEKDPTRARDELLITAAGPAVSVVLGAAAWGGSLALPDHSLSRVLLALLGWSNLVLAAFNLLPGLPLDGGRILRAIVWGCGGSPLTGTRVAGWTGRAVAVGVAVLGLVADHGSPGLLAGLVSVFLAAYLWLGAGQALKAGELQARLPRIDVDRLLRPGLLVPFDVSVAEALRRAWERDARGLVVLDAAEQPSAIVDENLIGAVPPQRRPWTPVGEVARPLEPGLVIPLGTDAKGVLERMQATPAHEYLVVAADGKPAGIIATVDFARMLQPGT